ncbi:GNAT family N-acetyltransferase [Paenibacillus nasutitermitis]|uniref:N-acetyltransferase n=1 Tax=Paenibacillus nasutitermitis TaxID=1652958 RepID=A0A916YQ15_9BACL|nr:GNAT family N-acetyltransferase [Paenibacillus nasutitermitis]GGD55730.1 N-acetyltransferase [Paenibacillus nasutitermitis]
MLKDDQFWISDDKAKLDMSVIKGYLARSYWAGQRLEEIIERSVQNSLCYGIYRAEGQVGFARVVTDDATIYYLCDVFIDEEFRGMGLGKKLVQYITQSERFRNIPGMLGTRDAHELYEQFEFRRDGDILMRRRPDHMRS